MPRLRRKRAFIIGPVREITDAEKKAIGAYVLRLEKQGYHVHWPLRDTHQSDPIGSQILNENCWEIERADEIHIWWNKNSEGSHFDLGIAFGMRYGTVHTGKKKFVLINRESVLPTKCKSFENALLWLTEPDA